MVELGVVQLQRRKKRFTERQGNRKNKGRYVCARSASIRSLWLPRPCENPGCGSSRTYVYRKLVPLATCVTWGGNTAATGKNNNTQIYSSRSLCKLAYALLVHHASRGTACATTCSSCSMLHATRPKKNEHLYTTQHNTTQQHNKTRHDTIHNTTAAAVVVAA